MPSGPSGDDGGFDTLARRNIIILAAVILFAASGLAGYGVWREHQRKQALIELTNAPGCSHCSLIKKDLAEKVRLREQQSEQTN